METFLMLVLVVTVILVIQHFRFHRLVAAGAKQGLTITAGPTLEQRESWTTLACHVHQHVPTSWGYSAQGRIDGQPVRMQEQEIRQSLGSNREWHTLVVLDLPGANLPEFWLHRGGGRPLLRQLMAPMVDPLVRALGGDPTPAEPGAGIPRIAADTEFCARWQLGGSDAQALVDFFDPAMRRKLLALELEGDIGGAGDVLAWFPARALRSSSLAHLLEGARRLHTAFART